MSPSTQIDQEEIRDTPSAQVDNTAPPLTISQIFTRRLKYDEDGKATSLAIFSFQAPHMRSFHLAWMGFCAAFTSWFALSPLLKKTIRPDVGLSDTDLSNSDISNVASTVVFRFLIGPLVDKLGPSRVMAILLTCGSIPLALATTISSGTGLIIVRAFIGLLGACFVPCQYWATAMFNKKVVGTANAVAGGWGNLGAGITNLVMPQIYAMFLAFGLKSGIAWRVSLVIPVLICLTVAALCWFLGDDKPPASFKASSQSLEEVKSTPLIDSTEKSENGHVEPHHVHGGKESAAHHSVFHIMLKCLTNPNILILMVQYACCFGVELSVDSVIGNYFISEFGVSQEIGGLFSGLFGLLNLFSRASGGLISDFLASKRGMTGRILWLASLFVISSAAIIGFSFAHSIPTALVAMIVFSYACQAGTGATFGIVPFSGPYMGAASGLIGAGGNIGGALFNVVFRLYINDTRFAFRIMGICVAIGGFCFSTLLRIQGQSFWSVFSKPKEYKSVEKSAATISEEQDAQDAVVAIV